MRASSPATPTPRTRLSACSNRPLKLFGSKAGKPTEFGKIVKLQEAENQIVVAYEVYDRRPSDSDLLLGAIETHQATLGCTPHLVAADAGFYSAKNEAAAKAKG